jgi:hypothetical protein
MARYAAAQRLMETPLGGNVAAGGRLPEGGDMRRTLAGLVVAVLAIALAAPAAPSEVSVVRTEEARPSDPWWAELLSTLWLAPAGDHGTTEANTPATGSANDPDHGPTMDPDG